MLRVGDPSLTWFMRHISGSSLRTSLPVLSSVAGLLLTTEVMVAEAPKEEEHKHGGMPDMGGMDM